MEPTGMSIDNCNACLNSIDHNGALIPHKESELQVVESAQAISERHHRGIAAVCNFCGVAHLLLTLILSCRSGCVVAYITRQGTRRLKLIIAVKHRLCKRRRSIISTLGEIYTPMTATLRLLALVNSFGHKVLR